MRKLINEVSSASQLNRAWEFLQKKKNAAPGIDDETLRAFGANLNKNISEISKELKTGKYKFSAAVQKKIPKGNNNYRGINVYTVRDKIVQKSIQISLEKDRKAKTFFPDIRNSISIGFLSKRFASEVTGMAKAIKVIKKNYRGGYTVFTVADIKDFFPNIDTKRIYETIIRRLPDESINYLIKECLSPEVLERDRFNKNDFHAITSSGVGQGSILSPLFSNIYLQGFDKELESLNILALRYADDVLVFSKSPIEAKKIFPIIQEVLKKTSSLSFYPAGTDKEPKHYPLKRYGIYLGLSFRIIDGGWEICPISKKINEMKLRIKNELNSESKKSFMMKIFRANHSLESWFQTYDNMGCTKKKIKMIYGEIKTEYLMQVNKILIEKGITTITLSRKKLDFLIG